MSRLLNEHGTFYGLSFGDFLALMLIFVVSYHICDHIDMPLLSLLPVAIGFMLLLSIRVTFRRKIIRDSISYALLPKVLYDPIQK